jgi:dephospho-CoA kinase
MLVIGVAGTRGSGKSLAAKAARSMKIPVVEMRTAVVALMRRRKMKITNRSLRLFADRIRKEMGKQIAATLVIWQIRRSRKLSRARAIVVNGIRGMEEAQEFKRHFDFVLVSMTAPPRLRFGRILSRGRRDDPRTFKAFMWSERMERGWGLKQAVDSADYKLQNLGPRAECEKNLRAIFSKILRKHRA